MVMRYGSVCSGIEAATVAWDPLGWEPAFFSDVEAFPRGLLRHHYPDVPLHGRDIKPKEDFGDYCDQAGFQTIGAEEYGAIDLLVGGTPCQSFSVAGKRGGLGDGRGNLALEYIRLADRKRPRWVVWENVPGVFSSTQGEDFRCFLSGLVRWSVPIPDGGWSNGGIIAPGPVDGAYGVAWRVLDAQYFGVAQRRRRVFVVGYSGDWRPAAAVLFERHSLQGHPAPRREAGEVAPTVPARSTGGGGLGTDFDCDGGLRVTHTLRAEHDASEGGTGRGTPLVPVMSSGQANAEICDNLSPALNCNRDGAPITMSVHGTQGPDTLNEKAHTLGRNNGAENAVALPINTQVATRGEKLGEGTGFGIGENGDPAFTLQSAHSHGVAQGIAIRGREGGAAIEATDELANCVRTPTGGGSMGMVHHQMAVRRLTPREYERLQGFPDDYTAIPWRNKGPEDCPDGPRYKALGNSMAVPVMRWIAERIDQVQGILESEKAIEIVAGLNCSMTTERADT